MTTTRGPEVPGPLDEIPGPRALPLLGNVFDIDTADPIGGFVRMAEEYGPIFRLATPGGMRLLVSGPELVDEVCDDARFDKKVTGGLSNLRRGPVDSGLFTSDTADPLWMRAHNILMAPFSLQSMRDYMPKMLDLADQLMDKWSRLNPGEEVDVPADMTRLTLDTIALCGFGYRFNSFYRDTPHPFVEAMIRILSESQARARQLPVQTRLRIRAQRQLDEDQAFMNDLVDQIVAERRAELRDDPASADTTDLLGRMLTGVDKQTGEGLPDANIRAQCITFLIAGHETTSGLLSFAIYYVMKNPDVLARARAEVDEVLGGTAAPTFEQVHRLRYVRQILDESLRLWPTAPGFTRQPFEDTVIGGRYAIPAHTPITILSQALHRHTEVWGPDAAEFNPDHTAAERLTQIPPNSYKPFGTGARACIGRQFAIQEALLVLGMLVQRFEFVDHLHYQLKTKTTLTVKPDDFYILVRPREGVQIERTAPATAAAARPSLALATPAAAPHVAPHGTPLSVLFGSNLGTAESIATRLAQEGTDRGFDVTLGALDDHVDDLPREGAALVICSSYNGTPPDNAAAFCKWITGADAGSADGVAYSVFGCGNTEWAATYQAVPTLLDDQLAAHGARRIHPRGEGNAAGDFDAAYRDWHADLWSDVAGAFGLPADVAADVVTGPRLSITLTNRQVTNPVIVSYQARPTTVLANRELILGTNGKPPERSTRHLEIALADGGAYRAGDHLGVLPRNDVNLIRRVIARFGLDAGQYVTIIPNSGSHTHLPVDEPAPLLGVLGSCVELQDVAGRGDIGTLARHTADPEQKAALEELAGDDAAYRDRVFAPNRSLLDLLEAFPECTLPFAEFLDMLPPLRPRYYSISSSPLVSPDACSITVGVLRGPARSGDGTFTGIGSGYLAALPDNGTVFTFVRPPSIAFRPPDNPHTPMIMIGAGTGVAPFRGFLQERAALRDQGVPVGPSLLFFGCRNQEIDLLYADELRDFQQRGLVHVENAFSRATGAPCRYVQDAMLDRADEVWTLLRQDAAVFVCGNASTMAPGVRKALTQIFSDRTGAGTADAQAWLAGLRATDRFVEDIWGG
jgi:cytochrome P450 / NADPH-cytochrome P450 reductase